MLETTSFNVTGHIYPPWVNVLDLYCGLASVVPAAYVLYLFALSYEYRHKNKSLLIVNFVCTHFLCQLLQTPIRLYKIYGGDLPVLSCDFISTALLISLVHIAWPFMCTPIDLTLEVSCAEWYKRTVTRRRYVGFIVFMHLMGVFSVALSLPFLLNAVNVDMNVAANSTTHTANHTCPAEDHILQSVPLAVQVFEYSLTAALGIIQCSTSSVKSCFGERVHSLCEWVNWRSDEVTDEHLSSGRHPGVSEFFHNRWHMYSMYCLGVLQFVLFIYLAAVPHLPYTGQLSLVIRCFSSLLLIIFPMVIMFSNPQTLTATRDVMHVKYLCRPRSSRESLLHVCDNVHQPLTMHDAHDVSPASNMS